MATGQTTLHVSEYEEPTRRAMLAGLALAPALSLGGAMAADAAPVQAETPIGGLFRAWLTAFEEMNSEDLDPGDEAAFDAACGRISELEAAIMHTPSTNAADLVMKIASFTSYGGFEISDCNYAKAGIIWDEMRALTGAQA